jgi:hypothetical protein
LDLTKCQGAMGEAFQGTWSNLSTGYARATRTFFSYG